jgi:hypothetical protein
MGSTAGGDATRAHTKHELGKSGRQIKFTPERIEKIKNLVGRGKSREEIAEIIGVTVGSLQVTCSRLGISLRRPNDGIQPRLKPEPQSPRRHLRQRKPRTWHASPSPCVIGARSK